MAFVLGLAVGGVVVGFAMTGREAPLPRRTVTATPVPAAPRAGVGARSPLGGVAVVNKACLRAINDNQTASAGLGDLVPALRALDAARIDRVLLELQSRQAQLQQDLRLCQVSGRLETATPAPSGSGH